MAMLHTLLSLSQRQTSRQKQPEFFKNPEILGLSCDSRTVRSGDLFFAIPGTQCNGERFINEAIAKGCAAIATEHPQPSIPKNIPQWIAGDVRQTLAETARYFYGLPDEKLNLYAVTGTNGKTTIAYLLQYWLSSQRPAGYFGTLFYDTGQQKYPASTTTPNAIQLQCLLQETTEHGATAAALELSSHALDQKRAYGLAISAAIFTHIAEDHWEYHGSCEAYFDAKARLFDGRNGSIPQNAILNGDDVYGQRLRQRLSGLPTRIYTYGCSSKTDITAHAIMTRQGKTFFDLSLPDQSWHVESPLLGSHNVLNVLASLTALWATGQFYENILERLRDFPGVPGRMQVVTRHNDILTIVDYAHTADALSHVLKTLKALCPERLLLVFGCGGCRDRAKRPRMMSVAQRWADVIWATSDNPRTEAQEQIFADMKAGMTSHHPLVHWISDRYEAIRQAVETAQARDILLIAGKGHENYQEIGTDRRPFDDAMILRQLMDQRFPK